MMNGNGRPRAIAMIRVSQRGGREQVYSPEDQLRRIKEACELHGWYLPEENIFDEKFTSAGLSLAKRPMLRQAVEMVERNEADVIVGAYLDRLTRDPGVRDEIVDRVELEGGEIWGLDMGKQSNEDPADQMTGGIKSMVDRYIRRTAGKRSRAVVKERVAAGIVPGRICRGYRRPGKGQRLEVVPEEAPLVRKAYEMRADGIGIRAIRDWLHANGMPTITYAGTQAMLNSPIVLGEVHWGDLPVTRGAHEAIVSRELWNRVQAIRATPGPKRGPGHDYLLSGAIGSRGPKLLYCGSCGYPLHGHTSRYRNGKQTESGRPLQAQGYTQNMYVCGNPDSKCPRRVAITASIVERVVTEQVLEAIADRQGMASAETNVREAEAAVEDARAAYEQARDLLTSAALLSDPVIVANLEALRDSHQAAEQRLRQVGGRRQVRMLSARKHRDELTSDDLRELIAYTISRVIISPAVRTARGAWGKPEDRIAIEWRGAGSS